FVDFLVSRLLPAITISAQEVDLRSNIEYCDVVLIENLIEIPIDEFDNSESDFATGGYCDLTKAGDALVEVDTVIGVVDCL
ncbi:20058_t:CDS:2, partial [Funneliformis geosporum]